MRGRLLCLGGGALLALGLGSLVERLLLIVCFYGFAAVVEVHQLDPVVWYDLVLTHRFVNSVRDLER